MYNLACEVDRLSLKRKKPPTLFERRKGSSAKKVRFSEAFNKV